MLTSYQSEEYIMKRKDENDSGNTKIKITEHFAEEGKTMGELLEELIIREAKKAAKD